MTGSSSEDDAPDVLDLRGLKCPLPALMAKRRLNALARGVIVTVISDDPMAAVDVPHMCHQEGFAVLDAARDGDISRFRLQNP